MSIRSIGLDDQVYQYLLKFSLRESPTLAQLRQATAKLPGATMQISPEQGQLMALLVKLLQARKTIDIGTFTGYSALVVAEALPVDGKVIACDVDKKVTLVAKQFWQQAGVDHKIDLRINPALTTLDQLLEDQKKTFDFIFIDADKKNYLAYYARAYELLRPGGIIAIDNVLWSGEVADLTITDDTTIAIREFNTTLFADDRVMISMIPIGDGLTLAYKK